MALRIAAARSSVVGCALALVSCRARSMSIRNRSPKLTVLSRVGRRRVWFLLHRGQVHRGRQAPASASLSTGVLALRRTAGELPYIDCRVQIAVQDVTALRVLTAKHAVRECQVLVY